VDERAAARSRKSVRPSRTREDVLGGQKSVSWKRSMGVLEAAYHMVEVTRKAAREKGVMEEDSKASIEPPPTAPHSFPPGAAEQCQLPARMRRNPAAAWWPTREPNCPNQAAAREKEVSRGRGRMTSASERCVPWSAGEKAQCQEAAE
jgi:hypothetical protein